MFDGTRNIDNEERTKKEKRKRIIIRIVKRLTNKINK